MIKKSVLLAGLIVGLMSTSVWAGGSESGTGSDYTGDRARACSNAKSDADVKAKAAINISTDQTITGHSSCDCSTSKSGSMTIVTCTVDAYWGKK